MTVPNVAITKQDGQTGVVKPSSEGILAIIGAGSAGTANQATSLARPDLAYSTFGDGPLGEAAAYDMAVAKKPVVGIKATTSTAAVTGSVTHTGAGTSVVTASGSTPLDDFDVLLTFITGGTVGVAGIFYTYSLDNGTTTSGKIALGTANSITIPSTGVVLALAAGTILAGQTEALTVKAARMTNANLQTALESLRIYAGSWEAIYVASADIDNTMVGTLDTWLSAREVEGKFRMAFVNGRRKNSGEDEPTFAAAMATAFGATASTRCCVGADFCDMPQTLRGCVVARPVALPIAARCMATDIARDAAYVNDGPLAGGITIADARGNPKHHDEAIYPGLDDQRLATLRTFDSRQGVYCNNPRIISADGSDYVYVQHVRVMNRACELAFAVLTGELSRGIRKDPATAKIFEPDAAYLEGLVQARFDAELNTPGRVSAAKFILSRNDDLSSNAGATITGEVQIQGLAYVKRFTVNARFVRTIAA